MHNRPLPPTDLAEILVATRPLWEEMRGQRLFLTGGTGFFGRWLLESFLHADRELQLNAHVTVLTRNPVAFRERSPRLALHPAVTLLEGDIATFAIPNSTFAFVIHAAAEVTPAGAEAPFANLVDGFAGMERVLQLARACGTRKLLLTSSGAAYGRQPEDLTHIPETYLGAPDVLSATAIYGELKRLSELACAASASSLAAECKIARCFAFAGPALPLDGNFAFGNFVRDVLAGGPIAIGGDGTPQRSYLYAADLAVWLWTILFRAPPLRIYNVGSEDAVSVRELAATVAAVLDPTVTVNVRGTPKPGASPLRYVPATARAREELGLAQTVDLPEAIRRTAAWVQDAT